MQPLSIDELRHPTEASRFALALIASTAALAVAIFVLVSLGRLTVLWVTLLVIFIVVGGTWFLLQLHRVTMLADAVKVSAETLPEVQEVLDAIRERLDYRRRLEMFVVEKSNPPVTLVSLFGVRILVAEGGALGDLSDEDDRRRLMFLLATYVGALKARHTRWGPFLVALDVSRLTVVVYPFLLPWFRATVYTGDRIAYACLGDLDVSLQAVYKTLVGKDVARHVRAAGFAAQALGVRRGALVRLAQLQRPVPHATNRYLDLLAFASSRGEDAAETVRSITASSPSGLERILDRLRRRRPSVAAIPLAAVLAGTLVTAGLIAGLQFRDSPVAVAIDNVWTEMNGSPSPTTDISPSPSVPSSEPPSSPSPTPSPPPPTETASDELKTLRSLVPDDVLDDCVDSGPRTGGDELAHLTCEPSETRSQRGDAIVNYGLFDGESALQAAFDKANSFEILTDGNCEKEWDVQGGWSHNDKPRGPMACYTTDTGVPTIVWADMTNNLLVVAESIRLDEEDLLAWWRDHAAVR